MIQYPPPGGLTGGLGGLGPGPFGGLGPFPPGPLPPMHGNL
jgi:hypothetical protein